MASEASFDWFWSPPLSGQPGHLMIKDTHPGEDYPEIPFVHEDLKNVLQTIEERIPGDVMLAGLSIHACDPFNIWVKIVVDPFNRRVNFKEPLLRQGVLHQMWDARVARH